jgi:hypothetical protein
MSILASATQRRQRPAATGAGREARVVSVGDDRDSQEYGLVKTASIPARRFTTRATVRVNHPRVVRTPDGRKSRLSPRGGGVDFFWAAPLPAQSPANSARHRIGVPISIVVTRGVGGSDFFRGFQKSESHYFLCGRSRRAGREIPRRRSCRSKHRKSRRRRRTGPIRALDRGPRDVGRQVPTGDASEIKRGGSRWAKLGSAPPAMRLRVVGAKETFPADDGAVGIDDARVQRRVAKIGARSLAAVLRGRWRGRAVTAGAAIRVNDATASAFASVRSVVRSHGRRSQEPQRVQSSRSRMRFGPSIISSRS